ncbi:DUF3617 domain-containing protein [Sulfuricella sp.]|uniref:DUF3617 domain-containing protein n=1 Tax=Sulfuricella sp. TaxID=2099377 RepID=UPI002C6F67E2|nr:DUF3617 family protein [Sulfuricella sp.]HUX63017.1 DUF3617 family protein [Sulfuricella sp.]
MKRRFDTRRTFSLLLLGLVAASLAGGALAADMPKRKTGLWEINAQLEGMPSMGAMQQCIDQNTDNLMQQSAKKEKTDCSVIDVNPEGNKVSVHSVCKFQGSTATTDAAFIGAFDTAYNGDMKTRFDPPMHGISESNMTMEAKWLGPCRPGQKPGDVIMPNIKNMNINELMKDPKIQELLKRQK